MQIKKSSFTFFAIIILTLLLISSCIRQVETSSQSPTSLSLELREIRSGILQGYLAKRDLPNSLELLAPPPKEGSAAYALDLEIAAKYLAMKDTDRKSRAVKDAVLAFPEATDAFNSVLDMQISEKNTPHLYMILRRSLADAGLSTYAAKNHYQRKRPFMVNNQSTCTPEEENHLQEDGSYPSGHTAAGWAWALILVEVFPDKADVILERGKQFGISRNMCNAHWHSDVVAGRMMGAATVARLHADPVFVADLAAAKEEVAKPQDVQ